MMGCEAPVRMWHVAEVLLHQSIPCCNRARQTTPFKCVTVLDAISRLDLSSDTSSAAFRHAH